MGGIAALANEVFGSGPDDVAETQAAATTQAANAANQTQLTMFREGLEATAPWRKAGETALNSLVTKINAGPGEYTKSPGYEARLAEGIKARERSAAARGGLFSGRQGKELTRFAEDYATNDYQNFLANYYNSLTPLQSVAGVGQTTASQNAVLGNQTASGIAANTIQAGNIAGQAYAGALTNQANQITAMTNPSNYLQWKYQYDKMNQNQGYNPYSYSNPGVNTTAGDPYYGYGGGNANSSYNLTGYE